MTVYQPLYMVDCYTNCIERCISEVAPGMYNYVDNTGLCYSYYTYCVNRCRRYCYDP